MEQFDRLTLKERIPTSFLDYNSSRGYYNGWCWITFRKTNKPWYDEIHSGNYIANSTGDGWFRSVEGNSKGYGLLIKDMKLTSKEFPDKQNSDFKIYKALMKYVPSSVSGYDDWDAPANSELTPVWIFIHNTFKIEDVMRYIEREKRNWVP